MAQEAGDCRGLNLELVNDCVLSPPYRNLLFLTFICLINTKGALSAPPLRCYALSPLPGPFRPSISHCVSSLVCGSLAGRGLTPTKIVDHITPCLESSGLLKV